MDDGVNVGRAHIEITPKIDERQAKAEVKRALEGAAKEVEKSLNKTLSGLPHTATKAIREYQKTQTTVLKEIAKEANRAKALDRQRADALKAEEALKQKAFEAQKRRIAKMMEAEKALAAQKKAALEEQRKQIEAIQKAEVQAYAMERKRVEAIQKAENQAYAEAAKRRKAEELDQQRRLAEIARMYDKKLALEKADQAAAEKASQQFIKDQILRDKYLTARAAGASPFQAGQIASGNASDAKRAQAELIRLAATGKSTASTVSRAFDNLSHTMSQLSTRIGLASFQLQLLGGFATTFLTGPALMGMTSLAREGLSFATDIGYARASMEALLPPATDVEKIIRQIKDMAIESPLFNTEDAISYAQKLAAVDIKANDLYPTMQALSNIFLTQGVAGPERASLALMAYTQILSKGKIGMDDLRQQFAEHVPGGMKVFEEAAKTLGFETLEELRNAMEEGEVSAVELNSAFIKMGNAPKYMQGATKAAQTMGGVWQAFQEDVQATLGMGFDANRNAIIAAINGIKPVVMAFIEGLVAELPVAINWVGRFVSRIEDLRRQYNGLDQDQKDLIRGLVTFTLASGPAAIAIGILGTALSGAANAASLLYKAVAIIGAGTALTGWVFAAVAAIGLLITAVTVMYTKSEAMRTAVERVANRVKDLISTVLLPVIDMLIGSLQSLEKTFNFLGLKSEHLSYVLLILAVPLGLLVGAIAAVVAIIKAFQLAMLALAAVAYAVTQAVSGIIWAFEKLFELSAKVSTSDDRRKMFEGWAAGAKSAREGLSGLIDVSGQWQGLTEMNSTATDGLQQKLGNMDFTVTGLAGAFTGLNTTTDVATKKQITLAQAIQNARSAMDGQANAARGVTDASDNWNQTNLALKDSIARNKATLDETTKAGLENRSMLKQAAAASYELMLQDIRSGKPMNEAIERHKRRTDQLVKEIGKTDETKKAAQSLIKAYGEVPPNVETLLRTMGYPDVKAKLIEILAQQKVAANPGMDPRKATRAEQKAWDYEMKEGLKGYWTGGQIRGPGGPTGDKIPILASDQEYMIRASAAKNLGKPFLDYLNRYGTLPVNGMYAGGGQVQWPVTYDLRKTYIPSPMDYIGGPSGGGGIGVQRMMAILRQQFPGLPLISGYRAGAMTSTGNRSYHSMGRAVDIPPRWDVFNWIAKNYGKSTKELIFTPAGGRQIKNGQPHVFTGGTIKQDHYSHVHWAYDNGGYVPPDTPFINKTGSSELMLNSSQATALEEKIRNSEKPVTVYVYVDGVRRDAEIVVEEKISEVVRSLGGL